MTIMRLFDVQAWPTLPMRLFHAVSAAALTSEASSTTYASVPPSSSTHFFRAWPAWEAMVRPARSEPVRDTPWTRSSLISVETCECLAYRLVYRPFGAPASSKILAIAAAERGQISACLTITTLPAISAGAAKRATW